MGRTIALERIGDAMPCDSIISVRVSLLEKSTDVKLLKKALENLGFQVRETATGLSFSRGYRESGSYEKSTGKLNLPVTVDSAAVKVEYSRETVNDQAQKFGWDVEWDEDEEGNPHAVVQRKGW